MSLQASAETISSISGFYTSKAESKTESQENEETLNLLDEIGKASRILKEVMPPGLPLKHSMNSLMVDGLLELNRDIKTHGKKPEEHTRQAKGVHRFFESFYGPRDWPLMRSGLLGEVATGIMLEEIGFQVAEATQEDDLIGKIDMWAIDEGGNMVLPVQCKTSRELQKPELYRIKPDEDDLGVPYNYRQIAVDMIKYLSKIGDEERFTGKKVAPLIIVLPGGESNVDSSYHMFTGRPSQKAIDTVTDLFYKKVWND